MAKVEDHEINGECLLFCIALLLGGNFKTQEAFLTYMIEDDRNLLLLRLKDMLLTSFDGVKKVLTEKNNLIQSRLKQSSR